MILRSVSFSFWSFFPPFLCLWLGLGVPLVSVADELCHDETRANAIHQTLKQSAEPAQTDYDHVDLTACDQHHCHCPSAHSPVLHDTSQIASLLLSAGDAIPPFLLHPILQFIPSGLERPPKA